MNHVNRTDGTDGVNVNSAPKIDGMCWHSASNPCSYKTEVKRGYPTGPMPISVRVLETWRDHAAEAWEQGLRGW